MRLDSTMFLFALLSSPLASQQISVVNAGFELPIIPAGTFQTVSAPPGWSPFGIIDFGNRTIGVLHPNTTALYPDGAPEGDNVGVAFLMDDPGNQTLFTNREAGLEQVLTDTLQTSTHYRLTVEVGNIANDPNPPHNAFQFAGFPGYRIELRAGGQIIAQEENGLLPAEGAFETCTLQVSIGNNHPQAGLPLSIRLVNLNADVGLEVNFDDVRLHAETIWTYVFFTRSHAYLPRLHGSGLMLPQSHNRLQLRNAPPNSPAWLISGRSAAHLLKKGNVLIPNPELVIPLRTDREGRVHWDFMTPSSAASGTSMYFQFWVRNGSGNSEVVASNGLKALVR